LVVFRTTLEMARMYTKKLTLLRIKAVVTIINIWFVESSLISINLIKNPGVGGRPARLTMIKIRVSLSFLVVGPLLIFFVLSLSFNRLPIIPILNKLSRILLIGYS